MADLKMLSMPEYDIILGCDWIISMGEVTMNLRQGFIMVEVEGEKLQLCTEQVQAKMRIFDEVLDVAKE
jgi:hypothetical protein